MHGPPSQTELPPSRGDDRATPMMAQYLAIKEANPGSLLFYRMGDFYELFFSDAEIAAKDLGIALTKRGRHLGEDIPMCGVPVHAYDHYLQKLIRLGHKVAICEQMEDPAEAKKRGSKSVVRRAVIRLITPGTLTEEALLDAGAGNHLAALGWIRGTDDFAIAWADISTGEFTAAASSQSRLAADLARINPSEILVADHVLNEPLLAAILAETGATVSPLPASRFDSNAANHRLTSHFGVATLSGFAAFSRAEISALGALLEYLVLTQAGQIPHLRIPRREMPSQGLLIDAATRANLELVRTQQGQRSGSLLQVIDRTVTPAGRRRLATLINQPLAQASAINERLDAVSFFHDQERLAGDVRQNLQAQPDIERALARLTAHRGGPPDLATIREGLEAARAMAVRLSQYDNLPDLLQSLHATLQDIPVALAEQIGRALGDVLPPSTRDGGYIAQGYNAALDANRSLRDDTRQVIAALQARYAEMTGVRSLKIKHNNVLGYFIEIPAQHADSLAITDAPLRFLHRQTVASAMRFATEELSELDQRIATAAEAALAIELQIFDGLVRNVTESKAIISECAAALASLDCYVSLAVLAQEENYSRPRIDDSTAFDIRDGRHPVVEAAIAQQGAQKFTTNDCALNNSGGRAWLLTGPNMAGKSTFLRQNALIAILAQAGSFVPARSAHIGCIDRLYSRVGAADDLARGRSTFMVEMVETAAILNQATEKSLVILDEIGRGTATFDGLSIAWATLEHLHNVNKCRTLFATHYHELTALTTTLANLAAMTMAVREWKGEIVFLHEVVKGAADRSYGIQTARLAGLPPAVIARAFEVLQHLERQRDEKPAGHFADDLPLFSAAPTTSVKQVEAATDALHERLKLVLPDDLSPRDALRLVYELKSLVDSRAKQ